MKNLQNLFWWIPLLLIATSPARAGFIQFQSAPERTALLELYTSEGCSSCPPAETWFSGLKESPRLWKDFAPVAFHVDYWNYLGWKDAWSDEEFSERQRDYAQAWRSENVYTPELVLNGKEWHNWFTGKNGPGSEAEPVGVLTLTSTDTNRWQVKFVPQTVSTSRYQIHAALLAGGIISDVKAGENSGRRLNHDFVVVSLVQIGMTASNDFVHARFIINPPKDKAGKTLAIAAWITLADELEPLQATGGWIAGPSKN